MKLFSVEDEIPAHPTRARRVNGDAGLRGTPGDAQRVLRVAQPPNAAPKVSDEAVLLGQIKAIFEESRQTYGSPRITAALRQGRWRCNHKRVARLMRRHGLVAKHRRQRARTTDSCHDLPVAPNQLNRAFHAERPDEKWVVDITYIATREGWLFLALVVDIFSRKIVGWTMDTHLKTMLVEQALRMALLQRQPARGALLHHSDRSGQYASASYQQLLTDHGTTVSMSRAGEPYDNALLESCIGTLKTECADYVFPSRRVARTEIFRYVEGWYNRRRLHSALGYLSPEQFEQQYRWDNFSLHSTG